MRSILIKDTTKEEREKIVADALGCEATVPCAVPVAAWKLTISNI